MQKGKTPSTDPFKLEILSIFPTLVGTAELPDSIDLNHDLASFIRSCEHQNEDYTSLSTVIGGWQSGPDFLDADIPAIRTLRKFIERSIDAFLLKWTPESLDVIPATLHYFYVGWAVILRLGAFQHEHVHARKDLVGVYYVEVPAPANDAAGRLTLTDPRSGRVASASIWESTQLSFQPQPGKLFIFPSFVPHRVDQVREPGERISINFDITLVGSP